jgi:hypothetical protein
VVHGMRPAVRGAAGFGVLVVALRGGWSLSLVMGLDQHRAQISAEWIDTTSGEIFRARVAPADRAGVRTFLAQLSLERPVQQPARQLPQQPVRARDLLRRPRA